MKVRFNLGEYKNTIIFWHGFRKQANYWNFTEQNHPILIETTLSKIANTVLVDIEEDDYKKSITQVCNELLTQVTHFLNTRITLVAHSQGCFYALRLAEINPNIFGRLLLLDPTLKTSTYLQQLKDRAENCSGESVEVCKVQNWDDLPDGRNLSNKVIVRIHLNIDPTLEINFTYLDGITNKNVKSRLIIHVGVSHMIHYKIPHVIIDSIKDLYRL